MKNAALLLLLALMACDGGPTAPVRTPPSDTAPHAPVAAPVVAPAPSPSPGVLPAPPDAPRLRQPAEDASIPQARPFPGCPMNHAHPWGLRIRFEWDAPAGDVESYDILVRGPNAAHPLVERTMHGTSFTFASCHGYVADHNLEGWQWRVRARDSEGRTGDWSRPGHFRFEPCRVDGRVCLAR
jgi:hypothetical protein